MQCGCGASNLLGLGTCGVHTPKYATMANYIVDKPLATLDDLTLDGDDDGDAGVETKPTLTLSLADIDESLDGFVLDGVLTRDECQRTIDSFERAGFSFWDPAGADDDKRRVRNADTLEFIGGELCAQLWRRLAPFVVARSRISPEQERCEPDIEGEWAAAGLNEHLLVNKYVAGGHFAPHVDGATIDTFNRRSLYTVLLYLNDTASGGATQILRGEQCDATQRDEARGGPAVARSDAVAHAVEPRAGRVLVYWHQTLHAGEPVGPGALKYCIRSDIMFERDPPQCTAPNDLEAFELYERARALEADGRTMEALPLFMRSAKISPGIRKAFRM